MERVLIEELVNSRHYHFTLHFELPLNLSMALHPEVTGQVEHVRQHLRPEGLMISGELVETIRLRQGGHQREEQHSFHFTYLIPREDLLDANLLNFELQVSIEQIQYHLIKKKGHVLLKQQFAMRVNLSEYHLRNQSFLPLGGMEKKTGIFLKPLGSNQKSFLKLYTIRLPDDYSLLAKLSGTVERQEIEVTPEGCLLDLTSRIQGEYVTTEQKLGTFFFERTEHLFLPHSADLATPRGTPKAEIQLTDLSLEKDDQLMILYHCQVFFYQKKEVDYYTGTEEELPPGAEWKWIEVEQVGHPIATSQLVEEELELSQLPIQQITELTGQCLSLQVHESESREQLFLTGELEYQITYLSQEGIEHAHTFGQMVEEMIQLSPEARASNGSWQFTAQVKTPEWQHRDSKIRFDALVEFCGTLRQQQLEPVLVHLPKTAEEVSRESFLLTERLAQEHLQFPGEEMIYLHRYASEILRCSSQVVEWQSRVVQGGWMLRGQGELTIYYLTEEGERHFAHPFRFYQYIPAPVEPTQLIFRAQPTIRLLDHELLEDGSVVQLQYLGQVHYTLLEERERELITEIDWGLARSSRKILHQGKVAERIREEIHLDEGGFFSANQRIRKINELQVELKEYQVEWVQDQLAVVGAAEVQIKYQTSWGKERWRTLPIQIQMQEKVATGGGVCQHLRVVPIIKGYEYRLTDHPRQQGQVELVINMELTYRLVGRLNDRLE